jgi:hypothetical protein
MQDLANLSASVHPKRFSTRSFTHKVLCAGNLNPRILSIWLAKVRFGKGFWAPLSDSLWAVRGGIFHAAALGVSVFASIHEHKLRTR